MRRRDFIALTGAAAIWASPARAQAVTTRKIGFLNSAAPETFAPFVNAFLSGLQEMGFTDGTNLRIEYRFANGDPASLPILAQELVSQDIEVLVATGGEQAAIAAKSATKTIPIVFSIGGDPIASGLAQSISHPGMNATGFSLLNFLLETKRLELIREVVPDAAVYAAMLNPSSPVFEGRYRELVDVAEKSRLNLKIVLADTEAAIDSAFEEIDAAGTGALLVGSNPFFNSRREHIVDAVARLGIPAIYEWREFALAGGLMSYGTSLSAAYRQVGVYAARILKGDRPGNLPVLQPTVFELVINLKTAGSLGISIPVGLLARADEVIE